MTLSWTIKTAGSKGLDFTWTCGHIIDPPPPLMVPHAKQHHIIPLQWHILMSTGEMSGFLLLYCYNAYQTSTSHIAIEHCLDMWNNPDRLAVPGYICQVMVSWIDFWNENLGHLSLGKVPWHLIMNFSLDMVLRYKVIYIWDMIHKADFSIGNIL